MSQLKEYRSRYYLKPEDKSRSLTKFKTMNKNIRSRESESSGPTPTIRDNFRNAPYTYEATAAQTNSTFHGERDDDVIMVSSDDVITYSYRFGKSGEINRYPINQVQQTLPIRGSRISLQNEVVSRKIRHRKKRHQRMSNNVSPEELVTIHEVPFVTNYTSQDLLNMAPQEQRVDGLETHGRGYFVGDTKIYDNNLANMNNANHCYGYHNGFEAEPSHFHHPSSYRSLSQSYKPIRPPPNSQSSSPVYTGSSGTSPEVPIHSQSNHLHPSSPASPDSNVSSQTTNVVIVNHCHMDRKDEPFLTHPTEEVERQFNGQRIKHFGHLGMSLHSSTSSLTQTTIQRRSAMKIPSSSSIEKYPRKTVQWLIDTKKRPEDISQDRKVVKHQVG
jgi:hypothetical protein